MEKDFSVLRPAPPDHAIHPLIAGRWSSRAADPQKEVASEVMNRLFEAARWAPSAANNQPWRILSFGPEDREALEKARAVISQGNYWALAAPRLLFVLTRSDRPGSGSPNTRAGYEAGMAAVQMALQAASEGLLFHQMAGFNGEALRSTFNIPGNFDIIAAVAVGWPGNAGSLSEKHRTQEIDQRTRKSMDQLVFHNGSVPRE
jgi:nitroreductase